MALLFDGRFSHTPNFSLYARIDRDPVPGGVPTAAGEAGSYEMAQDPDGSGGMVAKLFMAPGDPGRCEIRPFVTDLAGSGPDWGEAWWAWWTYLPHDWQDPVANSVDVDASQIPNTRVIIAQLHQTEDVTDIGSYPLMQLAIVRDRYILATVHEPSDPTSSRVPNLRVLRSWPVRRGVWEEWVYRSRVTINTDGTRYFYRNRRLEYSVTGVASGQNDILGPFFKAGLYTYANAQEPAQRVIYSRGIVIGDSASSYEEVTGHSLLERATIRGVV